MKTQARELVKAKYAVPGLLCLLLLALLVWRLAGDGFNLGWLFRAGDSVKAPPALDSFSEPSVGLAILRQEAVRMMLAYNENRNEARASQSAPVVDSASTGAPAVPDPNGSTLDAFNGPAAPDLSALKGFLQLRAEVRDLDLDLEWKLMATYCRNDWCKEFLDCYLRLVQQVPLGQPGMAMWTEYALSCAEKCSRTEEVTDALRHVIRFYADLPSIQEMGAVLDRWQMEKILAAEASMP